jgi:NADP-dependent 3-hydroxy acid dehydrogenase YdfG
MKAKRIEESSALIVGGTGGVGFASDAAKIATPGESVIGAATAAVAMFCRGMAYEAKRSGIQVTCITPSIVCGTDRAVRTDALIRASASGGGNA